MKIQALAVWLGLLAAPLAALDFNGGGRPAALEGPVVRTQAPAALPLINAPLLAAPELDIEQPVVPEAQLAPAPDAPQAKAAAMPSLDLAASAFESPAAASASGYSVGAETYDGVLRASGIESGDGGRVLEPSFEPPTYQRLPPGGGDGGGKGDEGGPEQTPRRPALSFSNPAAMSALLAVDPAKAIYGSIKRLRGQGSKDYWGVYEKGVDIDVVIRGENVFGRPTTITQAFNKPIGKLTRDDLKGTAPEYQLKAPIKQLRQMFMDRLEEDRKQWHENDEPVNAKTLVRVVKFKSYIELYRETHGPDSVPQPEPITPREPLAVKPEGALKPLSIFLPRAVFLDMDLFDGPVSKELLSDMAELQRTGVYFVGFSRKPYAAANSLRDKLIRQMSSYQLSILMPIRFMAVTDNGAVISEFPKGGNVNPVDVLSFNDVAIDVLRDAAQKAAEESGIPPKALGEVPQPAIREAADQFPGLPRRESHAPDPRVRFEIGFAKGTSKADVAAWTLAFDKRLAAHDLKTKTAINELADGRFSVSVQRTDLAGSLDRLKDALGKKFGLYLNASDILVLSNDPQLKAANPGLDFGGITGLKGATLVDNALGVMLGEAREKGFLAGSASRISSFRRDRQQYMSDILIAQDKAEQNINFFSGHVVHSANDWVVHQLQNGRRPTEAEYREELARRWDEGTREFKAVGMPSGETTDGMLRESLQRGVSMYKMIVAAADRKEILIGTEIPNFFMLKNFQRRSEALKSRYVLHTIFDFIALRLDPAKPGHATLIIYDFKTGPAQSRQKLDKDIQVQIYSYFARQKWVGEDFPAPYLSGKDSYKIDDVKVEFIYNAVKQPTTVTRWDLDKTRGTIIRTLDRIRKTEQQLLGELPEAKPAKKPKAKAKGKAAAKATTAAKAKKKSA